MKRTYWYILAAVVMLVIIGASCSAQAASPHTTDSNRQYIERVHGYAHGNSLGIQALRRTTNAIEAVNVKQDKAIAGKVDTTTFVADQARQDKATAKAQADATAAGKGVDRNRKAINETNKIVTRHTGELRDLQGRATQADLGTAENKATNVTQDKTLASHGSRLDGHDAQFAAHADVSAALNTRLGGAYERIENHEGRISSLERNQDRNNEAAAIGLAIAGHQFDTKGGFQTAVSISTVNNREALAIGMGGALSDRVFVNAGVASSGNTTGGVVSSTYSW